MRNLLFVALLLQPTTLFHPSEEITTRRVFSRGPWCVLGVALLIALGFASLVQAAPGDLDPSFGTNGTVTTNFGTNYNQAHALALQADDKIVAAGVAFLPSGDSSSYVFALARFNTDGSLDPTFGSGGQVTTDFVGFGSDGGFGDGVTAVAIQADGKIAAAGNTSLGSHGDFALTRYNVDGSLDTAFGVEDSLDTTFGGGGRVTFFMVSGPDGANALALQADGKIVVGGSSGLARFNSDGSLDTTFGSEGLVVTDFNINALTFQADGKIVVAGSSNGDFVLARFNSGP